MPKLSDGNYFVMVTEDDNGACYEVGLDTPSREKLLEAAQQGDYVYDRGVAQTLHPDGRLTGQSVELYVAYGPNVVKNIGECHREVARLLGATCFDSREVIFASGWAHSTIPG